MKPLLALTALWLAFSAAPVRAQPLDLGEFPPRETSKELEVAKWHYWKDGKEILAEARDAKGDLMATLRVGWPGDMTARIHVTTVEGDRDVDVVWHIHHFEVEFQDNRTGQKATIFFNAAEQKFVLAGPQESLEEFKTRESRVLQFAASGYADVLGHLNLGPQNQKPAPELTPLPEPKEGRVPDLCEWVRCDGRQASANDIGFTPARCCAGAQGKVDADCFFLSGGDCPGCCAYQSCGWLCAAPGPFFCSCSLVGTACGTSVFLPCDEWPPECT